MLMGTLIIAAAGLTRGMRKVLIRAWSVATASPITAAGPITAAALISAVPLVATVAQAAENPQNKKLWQGLYSRNPKLVQQALNYGANKDLSPREHNLSPLEFAALSSQHSTMKELLERKAIIIFANALAQNALLHLVQSGDAKGVRVFLQALPKNKDRHDVVSQALLTAAAKVLAQHSAASLDIVRSLVAAGARSPNDVERAIQHGRTDLLDALLVPGEELPWFHKTDHTPLHTTAWYTYPRATSVDVMSVVLKYIYARENPALASVLHLNMLPAPTHEVKKYLNLKTKKGATALQIAAQNGKSQLIQLLLAHGAEPHMGDTFNKASFLAAQYGHTDSVRVLWAHSRSIEDRLALHTVIQRGQLKSLKTFLKSGRPVNVRNAKGFTPLHIAIQHGQVQALKELLRYGAPLVNTMQALSPLQLAQSYAQKKARTPMATSYQHILRIIEAQSSCARLLGAK